MARAKPAGVSLRAYARRSNVSPAAAHKWKAAGQLVVNRDGTIDAAASDALRDAVVDPSRAGGRGRVNGNGHLSPEASALHKARAAREAIEAQIRKLELDRMTGSFVPRAQLRAVLEAEAKRVRAALQAMPSRLAPLVVGVPDQDAAFELIEKAVDDVCREINRGD